MNFDLGKIRMDFTRELNRAGDIITKDIKDGIDKGGNFGKKWKRNMPSTIAQKGFDKPLFETGSMQWLPKKKAATKQSQEVVLRVAEKRQEIGRYHNEGTRPYTIVPKTAEMLSFITQNGRVYAKKVHHTGVEKREWFGISDKAKSEIFSMVEEKIKLEIERA